MIATKKRFGFRAVIPTPGVWARTCQDMHCSLDADALPELSGHRAVRTSPILPSSACDRCHVLHEAREQSRIGNHCQAVADGTNAGMDPGDVRSGDACPSACLS